MTTRKEKLMAKVKELIKTNKEKGIEKDYGNMTLKQLEIEEIDNLKDNKQRLFEKDDVEKELFLGGK